jgi:putative OPT family oligopeptide transporter
MSATGYVDASLPGDELYPILKENMRYLGVGAMIVGGLWSIFSIRKGIAQGVRETLRGYGAGGLPVIPASRLEQDMPRRWLLFLVLATALAVLGLYVNLTGDVALSSTATVLMIVCSFFFVAVASYIVGLVGSSNSPVSGMTICSVLLTSAFVALFGYSGVLAIEATLGVAGVVCCATCTSGDVCQDLKTGSLVGATPYRQQWVELLGVLAAAFVMHPVLELLHQGYGIASDAHLPPELQGHALNAPQAALFANLMQGFFGDSPLPWDLIAWGAGIGLAIVLVDQLFLAPRGARFRLHVMPVAVGMYLPFGLVSAILLGGLLSWIAARAKGDKENAHGPGHGFGVLLASGLIAGEAIAGVLIAIPKAENIHLPELLSEGPLMIGLTVLVMVFISAWIVRTDVRRST